MPLLTELKAIPVNLAKADHLGADQEEVQIFLTDPETLGDHRVIQETSLHLEDQRTLPARRVGLTLADLHRLEDLKTHKVFREEIRAILSQREVLKIRLAPRAQVARVTPLHQEDLVSRELAIQSDHMKTLLAPRAPAARVTPLHQEDPVSRDLAIQSDRMKTLLAPPAQVAHAIFHLQEDLRSQKVLRAGELISFNLLEVQETLSAIKILNFKGTKTAQIKPAPSGS